MLFGSELPWTFRCYFLEIDALGTALEVLQNKSARSGGHQGISLVV